MPGVNSSVFGHPALLGVATFLAMWLAAWLGATYARRRHALDEELRQDFGVIQAAALTLLGLIIGFTFSIAIGRYDQRDNYEEGEATAIRTAYCRADLLPAADAATVRTLLRDYLGQRIAFYEARDAQALRRINERTAELQSQLWSAVLPVASSQPTPVVALAVSGISDVMASQGHAQSVWSYNIPTAAWVLMTLIALACNALVGYGSHDRPRGARLLLILPLLLAIAFSVIADIDAPRHGFINVKPVNLTSLADSLRHADQDRHARGGS
jgi:hypothetical protein